jgi:hypothetical protein
MLGCFVFKYADCCEEPHKNLKRKVGRSFQDGEKVYLLFC